MDRMRTWTMCRTVGTSLVIWGLAFPSPVAWAQLETADPVLHAAVEALVTVDPEVSGDPELVALCRDVAEATVLDPRERAAVAGEVAAMQREGVDISTVIPDAVRSSAREEYERRRGQMQAEIEALRSTNPEEAKTRELMMKEGERAMQAMESGERYVPSPEMMAHAQLEMDRWAAAMTEQGAPPEMIAASQREFTRWSSGEMMMGGGMMGGGHGGPAPSIEQMQAMGMSEQQIQMAQTAMEQGGANWGINPATGGWEPGMGGMHAGGYVVDQGTGPTFVQYDQASYGINPATGGWEPNMNPAYMPEGWAVDQSGMTHFVGTEAMSSGWAAGSTEAWASDPNTIASGWENVTSSYESYSTTHTYDTTTTTSTEAAQERQAETAGHKLVSTHTMDADGHAEEHWDGNGDNIADHTHPVGTGAH